jgi:hypothetical protein
MKYTLAHVTHEAIDKIGGIGTVLEGLITSPVYQEKVGRTILVGSCSTAIAVDPQKRLGDEGTVYYSSVDKIDTLGLGPKLHPIEWAFDVSLIYGKRTYAIPGDDRRGEAEVLMIDVFHINKGRLAAFKHRLWEMLGVDSFKYEHDWGFEEWMRIAEPAFYGLRALLGDPELPCILLSHEFMGLPTAFKCVLDGHRQFRTLFHAHECSTARTLVEDHPGHDTMFYNVMREAKKKGLYAEDVFGDQSRHFRHALISRAHVCDAIVAVGDDTAREMHFLGKHFDHHQIDMVYNGVPAPAINFAERTASRKMLADYTEELLGYRPDVLMTHVMRPVISKGVWRDLQVCHELEKRFEKQKKTGVLYILTSAGGTRRPQDVRSMEAEYNWPAKHRNGFPDLVGPEVEIDRIAEVFNAGHKRIKIVLVNQFGWDRERISDRLPAGSDMGDFRRAADVEFGTATYEPFGISPLEPLCAGAICVISDVCGCAGFVKEVTGAKGVDNVIIADYTALGKRITLEDAHDIGAAERTKIEERVAAEIADLLMKRLPKDAAGQKKLLEVGQQLVQRMGWDYVMEEHLSKVLDRVVQSPRAGMAANGK